MTDYGKSFTLEILEKEVNTGDNIVFSYPAGSGKTTAIRDYISSHAVDNTRKIIYVAPTKTLLDDMYNMVIDSGVNENFVFNYHSSSPEVSNLLSRFGKVEGNKRITNRIKGANIVLITHERMKFDYYERYLSLLDVSDTRPLVFIDEAIDSCNVATIPTYTLEQLFKSVGIINDAAELEDYKPNSDMVTSFAKILRTHLLNNRRKNKEGIYVLDKLGNYGIKLSDDTGLSDGSDLTDPEVEARFINFYNILSMQLAKGSWIYGNSQCYVDIPIAVHLNWIKYAQCIAMDATAHITPSLYKNYRIVKSDNWNWNKLTNCVDYQDSYSKTNLINKGSEEIGLLFSNIPIRNYNKIYIVTYKESYNLNLQSQIVSICKEKYPEYKIEYHCSDSTLLSLGIDDSTDELYTDSTEDGKIIYITNFGRTRGSNVFRECDCVIQLGYLRLRGELIQSLRKIYPNIDDDELTLSNFVQELYRGRIRCDLPMDSYTVIDTKFYNYLVSKLPELNFQFKHGLLLMNMSNTGVTNLIDVKLAGNMYGKHAGIVRFLKDKKESGEIIHKSDILNITECYDMQHARNKLVTIYNSYPELRSTLFNNFNSVDEFKSVLTVEGATRSTDIELNLN